MPLTDSFSQRYAEQIRGGYDCLDRIVLNGYVPFLQSGGGFRCWWREVFGNEDHLDNMHLMRWAGRFARRVRAAAAANHLPLLDKSPDDRMHELVQQHRPADPNFRGVFAISVHRAPNSVWDVVSYASGAIHLQRKQPWVNHYAFHIQDADWGHITIKVCPHPPFHVQVALHGHEYVACQALREGLPFIQEGNCFTDSSNLAGLERIAETLRSPSAVGRLAAACERWLYSACLCYLMPVAQQQSVGLRYQWSVYQMEFSRNLLFAGGSRMDALFQSVIDHTRGKLDVRMIRTLFGNQRRPFFRRDGQPNFQVAVERPTYDLTVFKVHCGLLTLKMYTKGECVLRVEAIVHHVRKEFPRCGIAHLPSIANGLQAMTERFLGVLQAVDSCWISDDVFATLAEPSQVGAARVAGLDLNRRRMRAVIDAVLLLSCRSAGFRSEHLAAQVSEILAAPYTPRQASYDLKKLRGKGWVERVGRTRSYLASASSLRAMAAAVVLREKVLLPLLSASHRPTSRRPRNARQNLNRHYLILQYELQQLLPLLGIAT
jgi:DNA-binding transcriptional ArsR family regulator